MLLEEEQDLNNPIDPGSLLRNTCFYLPRIQPELQPEMFELAHHLHRPHDVLWPGEDTVSLGPSVIHPCLSREEGTHQAGVQSRVVPRAACRANLNLLTQRYTSRNVALKTAKMLKAIYIRSPQPPGQGLVPVQGLFGISLHRKG